MEISEAKFLQKETPSIFAKIVHREYGFLFSSKTLFFAKVIVAIIAIFILVKSIQLQTIIEVFKTANWIYLITALILIVPNIGIQLLKWHYFLKLANPAISIATAYKSLIVGYPLGFITPGRLGEFGRAFYVKEINQIKTAKLFVVDKISNLLIILLLGLAGLLILFQRDLTIPVKLVLFTILSLGIGLLCFSFQTASKINSILKRFTKLSQLTGKNNLVLIILSTVFYMVYLTQFVLLIMNFHEVNPVSASQAAASVFLVKSILPISFGDLGIREGASVFFLGKIGVKTAAAFNAAILLYLFNIGIPTLIGLWTLLRTKHNAWRGDAAKMNY